MGIKKACSCGYWNQEQEECLYDGGRYCVHDEQTPTEDRFIKVPGEFVEKWGRILSPALASVRELHYQEKLVRQLLKEAGVEVVEEGK